MQFSISSSRQLPDPHVPEQSSTAEQRQTRPKTAVCKKQRAEIAEITSQSEEQNSNRLDSCSRWAAAAEAAGSLRHGQAQQMDDSSSNRRTPPTAGKQLRGGSRRPRADGRDGGGRPRRAAAGGAEVAATGGCATADERRGDGPQRAAGGRDDGRAPADGRRTELAYGRRLKKWMRRRRAPHPNPRTWALIPCYRE